MKYFILGLLLLGACSSGKKTFFYDGRDVAQLQRDKEAQMKAEREKHQLWMLDIVNSWKARPVYELDTHETFLTIKVEKTLSDNGIEVRNYKQLKVVNSCQGNTSGRGSSMPFFNSTIQTSNSFSSGQCVEREEGCQFLFYIEKKKITKLLPKGDCFIDGRYAPEGHRVPAKTWDDKIAYPEFYKE